MGNLPVVQEVGTGFQVVGDYITGHPERAHERVHNYFEESVIGSAWAGIAQYFKGNHDNANEYFRGCGRATGKAVLGGGFMRDVPVFHELAVCGESLGDVIGGGDTESAAKRWETYVESSVIGGGIATVRAKRAGDDHRAAELAKGFVKAGARCAVAGIGAVTVTAVTAPYGIVAAVAPAVTTAALSGGVGAASTAAAQVIDKGTVDDIGVVVGNGLFGGVILGACTDFPGILANNAAGVYHRSSATQDAGISKNLIKK